MQRIVGVFLLAMLVVGCASRPPKEPPAPVAAIEMPPPTETRGKFNIEADKLDTWNAVGQIVVRTPGVTYEGRSQMMDLYSVRYRDVEFMSSIGWRQASVPSPSSTHCRMSMNCLRMKEPIPMLPNLSRSEPAARYRTVAEAA